MISRIPAAFVPILIALLVSGCGLFTSSGVRKQFPGGHPPGYAELEAGAEERAGLPPEEEARSPQRSISIPPDASERDGLLITMRPEPEVVGAGNPILVLLGIRNTTSSPLPVIYPNEKRFDVAVFADPNQEELVHLWSSDRMFAQIFQDLMLGGGSSVTRTLEIPTTRAQSAVELLAGDPSRPLPPGTYWMWGTHEGTPFLATGPVEITVLDPDALPEDAGQTD